MDYSHMIDKQTIISVLQSMEERDYVKSAHTLITGLKREYLESNVKTNLEPIVRFSEIAAQKQEHLMMISFDEHGEVMNERVVTIGTVNTVPAHPREVLQPALLEGASSIIIAHNHPDTTTAQHSMEDRIMYQQISDIGKLVGIEVKDSYVLSLTKYGIQIHSAATDQVRDYSLSEIQHQYKELERPNVVVQLDMLQQETESQLEFSSRMLGTSVTEQIAKHMHDGDWAKAAEVVMSEVENAIGMKVTNTHVAIEAMAPHLSSGENDQLLVMNLNNDSQVLSVTSIPTNISQEELASIAIKNAIHDGAVRVNAMFDTGQASEVGMSKASEVHQALEASLGYAGIVLDDMITIDRGPQEISINSMSNLPGEAMTVDYPGFQGTFDVVLTPAREIQNDISIER
jgi:DNA repair protein RadC